MSFTPTWWFCVEMPDLNITLSSRLYLRIFRVFSLWSSLKVPTFSSAMLRLFLVSWGVRSVMERAGYVEKSNGSWSSLGSGRQSSRSEHGKVTFPESLWRFPERLNQEVLRICIPAAHSGRVWGSDVLQTGCSNTSSTDRTQSCWRDNTALCTNCLTALARLPQQLAEELGDRA